LTKKGSTWLQGVAPFKSNLRHQIVFEGVRGETIYGDIALDDIIVKRESCKVQPQQATPDNQKLVNCSFENGSSCFWEKDPKNSNFDWEFYTKPIMGVTNLPEKGALASDGYIYAEKATSVKGVMRRDVFFFVNLLFYSITKKNK
jgi:hypothetical protein